MRVFSAGFSMKVLLRKIAISILLLLDFAMARGTPGRSGSGEAWVAIGVGENYCWR